MTHMDWEKRRQAERVGRPERRYLKTLRCKAEITDAQQPKTRAEASLEIDHLKLGIKPSHEQHKDIEASVARRAASA